MKIFKLLSITLFAFSLFAKAQNTEFKITTWNVEWLSCSENGPSNEDLQMNNAAKVIKAMNADVVAMQEIGTSSSYATIDTLVKRLGDEWAGSIVAWSADNCDQNQAIVYRKSKVQLVSATLMSNAGGSYNWSSGRFPVLYNLNLIAGTNTIPVALINIHAKAMGDETSYSRRKAASESLKALLDGSTYNSKNVVLLGDYNDYLTGTQCDNCSPAVSPYNNFVLDTQNYKGLTGGLWDPGYKSPVIDNIIISNELFASYTNTVLRETTATQTVSSFTSTTSDHYPVSAVFSFAGGSGGQTGCENFSFSETFGESLGSFSTYSAEGTQNWGWRAVYGAVISGYQNSVANPNQDWLISPALDLSGISAATLSFEHAINYSVSSSDLLQNHTLWITDNYNTSQPSASNWTQMNINTMPAGNNWTFVNSGDITLPNNMLKENIRIAFKYLSDNTVASTWEIRNLNVTGQCINTQANNTVNDENSLIYTTNGSIQIENKMAVPVAIYDITGRILYNSTATQHAEFNATQQGIYLVRCGNKMTKVVVGRK
ncbi:MAG: choice-of-anchor J domain-containing protein [Paludibacter sp.]|jgi:endonuclease/exonuclease/phosphatase family metal-dependent hydrolase|nr:choice-of-anchor J domain-containing protein [Paludibacter sp.]